MADSSSSFLCHLSYAEQLKLLSLEECGRLWLALFDYKETGVLPEFDGALMMAFSFIRSQLDREQEAYEAKCKRNAENGKKGGRPHKE